MPGQALRAEHREEIRAGIERDESFAEIGRILGRPTSTISREAERNGGRDEYRATQAENRALRTCLVAPATAVTEASGGKSTTRGSAPHRMGGMLARKYPSDLSDAEWHILQPLVPGARCYTERGGRPEVHDKRQISRVWVGPAQRP